MCSFFCESNGQKIRMNFFNYLLTISISIFLWCIIWSCPLFSFSWFTITESFQSFGIVFHRNYYSVFPLLGHGIQFSSVQWLSRVRLFATAWTAARQASLSITNSRSSLRLTSIKSVMPSSHHIFCRPLLLLPPIPPSIRVFFSESTEPREQYEKAKW